MAGRRKETQASLVPNPILPLPRSSPPCPRPCHWRTKVTRSLVPAQVQTSPLTVSNSLFSQGSVSPGEQGDFPSTPGLRTPGLRTPGPRIPGLQAAEQLMGGEVGVLPP